MDFEGKVEQNVFPFPITNLCFSFSCEAALMGQNCHSFITTDEVEGCENSLRLVLVLFGERGVALVNFPLAELPSFHKRFSNMHLISSYALGFLGSFICVIR